MKGLFRILYLEYLSLRCLTGTLVIVVNYYGMIQIWSRMWITLNSTRRYLQLKNFNISNINVIFYNFDRV